MFSRSSVSIFRVALSVRSFHISPTLLKTSGVVKWFDVKKGYGFISVDELGKDIFVHQLSIAKEGFRSLKGIKASISMKFLLL